ncbi:hypothetical protein RJ639_026061 [Escallonia herrerae]|uniref:Uncharacterized protein n=1 Tax=Escallonia herrerae TaxID=1293975 RepID=A0AA88UXE5_9ASTE|nr:hypothetical protein RJ639_026061 [Escallonia herrerae]
MNVPDETVVVNSPGNDMLKLIRSINPNMFIHGILNGTYTAPFTVKRFREALFHFSTLFDKFKATTPREDHEIMMFEHEQTVTEVPTPELAISRQSKPKGRKLNRPGLCCLTREGAKKILILQYRPVFINSVQCHTLGNKLEYYEVMSFEPWNCAEISSLENNTRLSRVLNKTSANSRKPRT